MTKQELLYTIELLIHNKKKSAWKIGVLEYTHDLANFLIHYLNENNLIFLDITPENLEEILLNGSINWTEFSYDGNALCYDYTIASRLCTPSEYDRTNGGSRPPNKYETWCDIQARALVQAYNILYTLLFSKDTEKILLKLVIKNLKLK